MAEQIKEAIMQLLNDPKISSYQIAKATGISEPVLHKYRTGKSNVDNMTLGNALRLYRYYQQHYQQLDE